MIPQVFNMSEKELDKFTRNFLIRAVQIIVESRLGDKLLTTTSCNARGHDWFNLSIKDIKDVAQQTKACLDKSSVSIKDKWQFCVEISLKTPEGETMVLEYWIIANESCISKLRVGEYTHANLKSGGSLKNSPSSPKILSGSSLNNLKRLSIEEEVFQVYNRMSLMLKSLISFTRTVPAFKLSSSQSAQSFVICYRVYFIDSAEVSTGSGESANLSLDTTSAHANASLDQRLILDSKQRKYYSPVYSLGSIISSLSKISVSCIYREEINGSTQDMLHYSIKVDDVAEPTTLSDLPLSSIDKQKVKSEDLDENLTETINTAKDLGVLTSLQEPFQIDDSHFDSDARTRSQQTHTQLPNLKKDQNDMLISTKSDDAFQGTDERYQSPLNAAFAHTAPKMIDPEELPETPFDKLIDIKQLSDMKKSLSSSQATSFLKDDLKDASPKSNPIAIPGAKQIAPEHSTSPIELNKNQLHGVAGSSPAYGSSAESFVFVDLKAPFVQSEEQDLNSFFVGPSPTFSGHHLSPADLADLTNQFAALESNIEQWDSFVESVCLGKDDENEQAASHHSSDHCYSSSPVNELSCTDKSNI